MDTTRQALVQLAQGLSSFERAFGSKDQVDPIRHLIGCAAIRGGLPDTEAQYLNVNPELRPGEYQLTVHDVPVDGFWSISLYNAEGYFPQDAGDKVSINNLTAARDLGGSITIRFSGSSDQPNYLPTMNGWNYIVRLYRPRPEVLNGIWTFPAVKQAS